MTRLATCWVIAALALGNGCSNSNEAQSELQRGIELAESNNIDGAIEAFNLAVQYESELPEAHFRCGLARCAKGEYTLATFSHQQAVRLKPDYAPYLFARGLAYLGDEQYDEAVRDFQAAQQMTPGDALQAKIDEMLQLAMQTQQQRGAMGIVGTVFSGTGTAVERTWYRHGLLGRSDFFSRHPAWAIVFYLVAHLFGVSVLLGIWLAMINGMGRSLTDGEKAGIAFLSLLIGGGSYFLSWGYSYWGLGILCTLWTMGIGGHLCKSAPRMKKP